MTMEPAKPDLIGHDVLLEDGKIAAIEKFIGAGARASGAEIVDGTGKVLMPGFTDGFRHNWQSVNVGRELNTRNSYADYDKYVNLAPIAMSGDDYRFSEFIGGLEAINAGYTNVVNFAYSPFDQARLEGSISGYKESGAAGVYCWLPETDPAMPRSIYDPRLNGRLDAKALKRIEWLRATYFGAAGDDLAFGLANYMGLGTPTEILKAHFKALRSFEPRLIVQHYNRPKKVLPPGTIQSLDEMHTAGLLQPDYMLTHALALTDEELVLLAKSGMSVSSAPLVEMSYDPVRTSVHGRAKKFGVPAAFGFDTPLEAVRDPFEMMRMGMAVLFKDEASLEGLDPIKSGDLVAWQTSIGAVASNRGEVTGTITVGKRADVILVKTDRFGIPANGNLADRVVNFCAVADVDSVWIGGKRRKKDGRMIGVDWAALRAERTARDERIWQRMGNPEWGRAK